MLYYMPLESARTVVVWFSLHHRVVPGDVLAKLKIWRGGDDDGTRSATILILGRCSYDLLYRHTVHIPPSVRTYTFIRRFGRSHEPELNIRRMIVDGVVYHSLFGSTTNTDVPIRLILNEWRVWARASATTRAVVECLGTRLPLDIIHHEILPRVEKKKN
jgi:hypothetical protein